MRVLLVNPNREHSPEPVPPVGLCQVATAASAAGHDVEVLDLCFVSRPQTKLRRTLRRLRPDVVGFTVRNVDNADAHAPRFYLDAVRTLAEEVRAETGAPPIVGGAGLTMDPERVMRHLGVRHGVVGAAENAFPRLLDHLGAGREGALPPAVALLTDDGDYSPAVAAGEEAIPFESAQFERWLDLRPYFRRGGSVSVQTRRGCPLRCVYCNYPAIEGRVMTLRDPREVAADVVAAAGSGAEWVEFADAVFNRPREHAVKIAEAVIEAGAPIKLRSSIAPSGIDTELAELLRKAGFAAAFCSPDAAHPATLESYEKGFTRAELEQTVSALAAAGIPTMFCFILGGPGETQETLAETIRFAREACGPPHAAMLATRMRVYPRTPLAELAGEAPLRPTPDAFYLAGGLDPQQVDGAADAAARECPHIMYMDSGRGPIARLVRRILAAFGANVPAFRIPSLLRGDRGGQDRLGN